MTTVLQTSGKKHNSTQPVSDSEVGSSTKDDVERKISVLERLIATAMTDIASNIEKKYVEYIPDFTTSNKLLETIRSTCNRVNLAVDTIADNVENITKKIELNKKELERLKAVKEWKLKMRNLEEIESLLCQLWYSTDEENAHANARLILELEAKLKNMLQEDETIDKGFVERIAPALKGEVVTLRQSLSFMLNNFWDQTFSVREVNGKIILQLAASGSDALNEKLCAMDLLDLIDGKLSKLSSALLHHFCERLIVAKDPTELIRYGDGTSSGKCEYVIRKEKQMEEGKRKRPDPEKVLRAMLELFTNLSKNLNAIKVNDKNMVQLIGNKISNEIVEMIVHECVTPAIPYESEELQAFEALLKLTNEFGEQMKKLGFFLDTTKSFEEFAENYENTFIDRRCAKIIEEARTLIERPLTEFVSVGNNGSSADEAETVEEFFRLGLHISEKNCDEEGNYPKLLQLPRCEVSNTAIAIADLVVKTLNNAAKAESASAMGKILQTARNIVELYVVMVPRVHDTEISSVPVLAAVTYNNCYYMCHRLMIMTVEVLPKMQNVLQANNLCISFADFIPTLRQIAAESMEKQLTRCRRELSTLLVDDKIFFGLDDVSRYERCMKCLDGCMIQLKQISQIWKKVLTDVVYANCVGNIVSFFFNTLIKMLLSTEDFRATDAELCAIVLRKVLQNTEMLFIIGQSKQSAIHRYAETPYYRFKELLFCLDSSLQNIYDRWCDGKGILAQWLRANEVRHLVKALFQNTEKRAYVLSKIN